MNNKEWQALAVCNLKSLVGKTIEWKAPAAKENYPYKGKDTIISVSMDKRNPLECKSIEGDELKYAFVDDMMNSEVLSYSDSYRVVTYKIIENE